MVFIKSIICVVGLFSLSAYAFRGHQQPPTTSVFTMPSNATFLDDYLNEMYFCYDLNRDGALDINETRQMVKGQLGEMNCDSFSMTDSKLLKGR